MVKPVVWKMIIDAVDHLNGEISYSEIKKFIYEKWGEINSATVTDQIQVLTVNHKSRIHYPENHKPRLTNSNSRYDFLYTTGRGRIVKYDPAKHGIWQIHINNDNKLAVRLFREYTSPNTYLFVWNPSKWNWITLEEKIEQLKISGNVTEKWSCRSYKTIKPGDRAFLARVASEPRGIFAAGYVASKPFLSKHWSGEGKDVFRVLIDFEVLLNPEKEPILTLDILNTGNLENQQWSPQSSGISIKSDLVDELEALWFNFLTTEEIGQNPYAPTESEEHKIFMDGTPNQVIQTRYERNPFARATCIKHYGYSCSVCDLDFEKRYGKLGRNFIHVHHLIPVATVGRPYAVDPIKDLRPVCPNCHAMLHKEDPPMKIKRLKALLT